MLNEKAQKISIAALKAVSAAAQIQALRAYAMMLGRAMEQKEELTKSNTKYQKLLQDVVLPQMETYTKGV